MFRTIGERFSLKQGEQRARERSERRASKFTSTRNYQSTAGSDVAWTTSRATLDHAHQAKPQVTGKLRSINMKVDVPLMLLVITLLIFGAVMVYSASYDYSLQYYGNAATIFYRQLIWIAIGSGAAIFLTMLDYHRWQRWAVFAMGGTVMALIFVLLANEVRNNAVRTMLGGSVQPSELAKLVTVIYLAVWLFAKREKLHDIYFGLLPLAAILGVLGGLIFVQPDLSAVATIMFLGGMMFFLAGGDLRQIAIVVIVALLVGWLVVQVNITGSTRVKDYAAGLKDPTQASYHVRRSLESFVKGKWVGVGIGKAETKLTGLPVPQTDSIFAVVGEETGVFGAGVLVVVYSLLLWRGLTIAQRAPDQLGAMLAAGLALWLAVEAFINMAVMLNLLPFAGNALPFISAGGSNLIVSMAAIGILLNISRTSVQQKEESGRTFSAVIDLRRRDRRRRVSSSIRPGSGKVED